MSITMHVLQELGFSLQGNDDAHHEFLRLVVTFTHI